MKREFEIKSHKWLILLTLIYFCLTITVVYVESKPPAIKLRIAAAANLMGVLETLTDQFEQKNPHIKLEKVFGSSGNLAAQILNGAPYHLFFSADSIYPEKLAAADWGWEKPKTYAYGLLCLASRHKLDETAGLLNLASNQFKTIAIAKPQLAPYGQAALASLKKAGLDALLPKVIWAENVSQACQYVLSGAVDAGFVALSAVHHPGLPVPGKGTTGLINWLKVDTALYQKISQSLLIIKSTENSFSRAETANFVEYVLGTEGRNILISAGYELP